MSKSANLTLTKDWACFNLLASSWPSPWPPPPAATSLDLDLSTFRLTTFHECVDSNNDVGFHFQKYLRCSLPNEERVKIFFLPNEDLLFHLAKNVSYAFSNTQKLYEGKNSKRIFVRCSLRGWWRNCDSFVRLGRRRYNFVVARKVCACQHFFFNIIFVEVCTNNTVCSNEMKRGKWILYPGEVPTYPTKIATDRHELFCSLCSSYLLMMDKR